LLGWVQARRGGREEEEVESTISTVSILQSRKVEQHMYVRQDHKYYPIFELKTQAEHLMLIKMVLISRIIMLLDKTGKAVG
jgi:hypothetical protein